MISSLQHSLAETKVLVQSDFISQTSKGYYIVHKTMAYDN